MTYNLDVEIFAPEKDEPYFQPVGRIFVKNCTKEKFRDDHLHTLISPEIMTSQEIDYEGDRLIAELETIRKKAKKSLQKEKDKSRKNNL